MFLLDFISFITIVMTANILKKYQFNIIFVLQKKKKENLHTKENSN